jgi:hypothetical protein
VLNQLGVCAGKDTLNRYTENVGSAIMDEGPFAQLPPRCEASFMSCSIDNADKTAATRLRRFGQPVADMHVVTVQNYCKRPLHLKLMQQSTSDNTGHREESSGSGSTLETREGTAKVNIRAQTLTEGKPARRGDGAEGSRLPAANTPTPGGGFQGPFTDLIAAGVTKEMVLNLSTEEEEAEKRFNSLLFDAVLAQERTAVPKAGRRSLRDCLAGLPGAVAPEKSEVVYVATWPLRASNKEEFAEALLRIKEKLEVGTRFKELLVVGDQQTWEYMDELRSEYAEVFGWLLHMPGDCHTLLNAQPVMKKMF